MFYNIDDLKLHLNIYGEGKPVLMLHGYRLDNRSLIGCMEPIFQNIKGFKRIYPDLPGMGKTRVTEKIRNSDDILNLILKFIDKEFPNEKFILVGYSYGGYLARAIISKKINYIDGVLLIAPLIIPDKEKRNVPSHSVLEIDQDLLNNLSPDDAEEFRNTAVIQTNRVWKRYRDEILSGVRSADPEFMNQLWKKYSLFFEVDEKYESFEGSSLILLGKQDAFVGYLDALKIINKFPKSTVAFLDKAGHILQIEHEKLFNQLVMDWIERI